MSEKPTYEELEQRVREFEKSDYEHRKVEKELRRNNIMLESIVNGVSMLITYIDCEGRYMLVNQAYADWYGVSREELLGKRVADVLSPDVYERASGNIKKALGGQHVSYENKVIAKDGSERYVGTNYDPHYSFAEGKGFFTTIIDITEHKKMEKSLRESEERFRQVYNHMSIGVAKVSLEFKIESANPAYCKMLGYHEEELIGKHLREITHSDVLEENLAKQSQLAAGEIDYFRLEKRFIHKNSNIVHGILDASLVRDGDGKPLYFLGSVSDITERKHAEQILKESEERFRNLMENIDAVAVQGYGPDGTTQYWNKASERLYGYTQQEAIGCNLLDLIIPSEMKGTVVEEIRKMAESGQPIPSGEILLRHKDGSRVPVISHHAIVKVPGREQELFCLDVDMTERKQGEKEREKLRKQLNQAQKMESVGRLAGGVAHDFNNMLSVILGNAEIIMEDIDLSSPLVTNLEEIYKAAERSANLTRQLLAFARKQTIAPKILNLNHVLNDMLKMLKRLIGEDINLIWQPAQNLWSVKIDPSQVDQILANLCVNARDAIKSVGKVTIETDNISFDEVYCKEHAGFIPGDYVMMAVSDNGSGMDKKTLDNLFEPFFTTKDIGQGTGLGLATVYGIVKQNNGFISVYSEPGEGTTFKIYLPVHSEPAVSKQKDFKKTSLRGNETILLVEDEEAILRMTKMMLERLGYTVLIASTPNEAISIVEVSNTNAIHLLMTDVVMPEMNGRDLSKKLLSMHPGLKCLFMSGYTANVIAHHGVLDKGVQFINKPFSRQDLATKVREVLDDAKGEKF